MRSNNYVSLVLFYLVLLVLLVSGWVMNLVLVFANFDQTVSGEFLVRLVGICIPIVGAIMGWCY